MTGNASATMVSAEARPERRAAHARDGHSAGVLAPERATYTADFHAWANGQSTLLRARRFALLDIDNVVEELEWVGRKERSELENGLATLLLHLLKWEYQPSRRGASWDATIDIQRRYLAVLRRKEPSLRAVEAAVLTDTYDRALVRVERKTGLPERGFPSECPYPLATVLDRSFWPGGTS